MTVRRGLKTAVGISMMVVTAARCGSNSSAPPTSPTAVPTVAPTPVPTPVGIVLPAGMVCDPTPPPLLRLKVVEWRRHGNGWVLDSSPEVPNVDNYCDRVGFGSWKFCFTRPEGHPQRVACDYLVTGTAKDTGRWGPTWTVDVTGDDHTARGIQGSQPQTADPASAGSQREKNPSVAAQVEPRFPCGVDCLARDGPARLGREKETADTPRPAPNRLPSGAKARLSYPHQSAPMRWAME
jgi:hypothetical protein